MLKKHLTIFWVFGLLSLVVIPAAIYMAPSHREIALMQMNDLNFDSALKNYNTLHSQGDHSINVTAPLVQLSVHYGDLETAKDILETYITDHPDSTEGWKKLAELYKSTQDLKQYCGALEHLQKLSPSADNLRQLADTYNFLGDNDEEMLALERLTASDGYQPKETDYFRLAFFYRLHDQSEQAIDQLQGYIKHQNYTVDIQPVLFTIQLLLESDEKKEAIRLAEHYLNTENKDENIIQISSTFDMNGDPDSAYEILKPFLKYSDSSINFQRQLFNVMIAQKKSDKVFEILSTAFDKNHKLPPDLVVILGDLAVGRDNMAVIEAIVSSQELTQLPEDSLLRYADAVFRANRPDLAQLMLTRSNVDSTDAAPVLKAVLHVVANDTPASMAQLEALNTDLSVEAKIVLADIFIKHRIMAKGAKLLDDVPLTDISMSFDPMQYADLCLSANTSATIEDKLTKLQSAAPSATQDYINQTLILLAAGEGKTPYVLEQLAQYPTDEKGVWPDTFELAVHFNQKNTALEIIKHLFKENPSRVNRLLFANALFTYGYYPESLSMLQSMAKEDLEARLLYLDAAETWSKNANGLTGLTQKQKEDLKVVIVAALNAKETSAEQKGDFAYLMAEAGFYPEATSILINFASSQPFGSADVQSLLGFLSDHPSDRGLMWVESRARQPNDPDQPSWLLYLNDVGHPQTVKEIVESQGPLTSALTEQYVNALTLLKDKEKLSSFLEKRINSENDNDQIRKIAALARQEDLGTIAEKGWRKIYDQDPGDNEAATELGLIAFYANHYQEAEPLLKQAITGNNDNIGYRELLAYGQILQQTKRPDQASAYFKLANEKLQKTQDHDLDTELDQARLLYLTGSTAQSFDMYHELLRKYPDNKNVLADLVEQLIEAGQYDEATALLQKKPANE
jgi:predicted Zn-dependent protease